MIRFEAGRAAAANLHCWQVLHHCQQLHATWSQAAAPVCPSLLPET